MPLIVLQATYSKNARRLAAFGSARYFIPRRSSLFSVRGLRLAGTRAFGNGCTKKTSTSNTCALYGCKCRREPYELQLSVPDSTVFSAKNNAASLMRLPYVRSVCARWQVFHLNRPFELASLNGSNGSSRVGRVAQIRYSSQGAPAQRLWQVRLRGPMMTASTALSDCAP